MRSKPVWTEGMLLQQQHLQYWQSYLNEQSREGARIAQVYDWGLLDYEFDESALREHCVRLIRVMWRLPNGEIIQSAKALTLELPQLKSNTSIYLTLPIGSTLSHCPGYESSASAVQAHAVALQHADDYDAQREAEIIVAEPNLRLQCQPPSAEYWSVEIARCYSSQSMWHLQQPFFPCCCRLPQQGLLYEYTQRIHTQLHRLITELADFQKVLAAYASEQAQQHYWLLLSQLLRDDLAHLEDAVMGVLSHPLALFRVLRRLAYHLQTPREDLCYQHEQQTESFTRVFSEIELGMVTLQQQCHLPLQLQRINAFTYQATLTQSRDEGFTLFLAIKLSSAQAIDNNAIPKLITMSSAMVLPSLRQGALPGLAITPCQQVPSQLVIKPGYSYFYCEPHGSHWDAICEENTVMLYINEKLSEVDLELHLV